MMKAARIERRPVIETAMDWPDSIHPVLRRVYAARGITRFDQIEHRLASLLSPKLLGGLERACELIAAAIQGDQRIIIVGDFDADGATGTAVAVRGLRMLGAREVDYAVPNRFIHGYGLSVAIIDELVPLKPHLIITVDNGIVAHAGVAAARAHGMRVIVTDHHLPAATLPDADAIVNPNVHGDEFPSKALAGVGVMFYLLLAVRAFLRERGWFAQRAEPYLSSLLDLVALGTVADLVPLDYNNRILIDAGIRRIRSRRGCAGIEALIEAGKRDPKRIVASDLGFAIAPRINAAGRLEDMRIGIECLLTDDISRARQLAETLSSINTERQGMQAAMVEQAEAAVDAWMSREGGALPCGVLLFDEDWHHGIVGLVASKLKDKLQRPVIACAPAENGEIKASGRSISGFHLRDALAEVDARQPGLLHRFGGHAMAAGLTMHRDHLETLARLFDDVARERIAPELFDAILLSDGELCGDDFKLDLAEQLRFGGPWGQAFPEPLFDGNFAVDSWRVMGEAHLRFNLRCDGFSAPLEAVMFNCYAGGAPPNRFRARPIRLTSTNGTE